MLGQKFKTTKLFNTWLFKLWKKHENRWEAIDALNAIIFPPIEVLPSSYELIYNITFSVGQNKKSY
jgi:hypothetical protein